MTDLLEEIEPWPTRGTRGNSFGRLLEEKMTPDDETRIRQLSVVMNIPFAEDVILELIRRALSHQNGQGYENVCSSCGKTYLGKRRALPGKRNYCDGCRATGEPAAQRARDYRDRKREA